MKTTNNVQKAAIKSVAIIICLVLLQVNVQAQNIWKAVYSNENFDDISMAMAGNIHEVLSAMATTGNFENIEERDAELHLEGWMTSDSYFSAGYFDIESEEPLMVEEWMLNNNAFGAELYYEIETEEALKVDSWMLNEENFEATLENSSDSEMIKVQPQEKRNNVIRTKNFVYRTVEESSLDFEAWMFNSSHFRVK